MVELGTMIITGDGQTFDWVEEDLSLDEAKQRLVEWGCDPTELEDVEVRHAEECWHPLTTLRPEREGGKICLVCKAIHL